MLLLCCCCCVTVNARCWVECPESQRGLSEPECFLKDDGTSTSCRKHIYNSDLTGQSISGFKSVLIWVELSTRVVSLDISNSIWDRLKLGAALYNYNITRLYISSAHIRSDLIYLLPNLKHLVLGSVDFHYIPRFSLSNQFLTYIYLNSFSIRGTNSNIIRKGCLSDLPQLKHLDLFPNQFMNLTDQTFSGLTALTKLYMSRCHIPNPAATLSPLVRLNKLSYWLSELTDISFLNKTPSLYKLKFLSFYNNLITSIQSNTFSRYSYLTGLHLWYNLISRLEAKCFKGLIRLKHLDLGLNQLRELNAITFKGLKSLTRIDLYYNLIPHLSSRIFESLPKLNIIYLIDLPLHCDCSLQWMSIVNLDIRGSSCAIPQHIRKPATDPSIYADCTQELSYQCFNRSNSCHTGSYCQDTLDSYTCVCEENYLFATPLNKCVSYDQLTQWDTQCSTTNP